MKLRAFICGLALAAIVAPLAASAQVPYGWQTSYNQSSGGTIASVNGTSFTLQNGTTVFLHQGTVINPRGTTLQPGMRVRIFGSSDGYGRINATEVDVNGNGTYNGTYNPYNNNPYNTGNTNGRNGWYDRNGNWHPGRSGQKNGWYDQNGNWHNGRANGWQNRRGEGHGHGHDRDNDNDNDRH